MKKYKYFISLIVILAVAAVVYVYWSRTNFPIQKNNTQVALPNIPTPAGWYSWGENHYPDYETSTIPNSVTFGDQPISNSGNNTTTLIGVNAQDPFGRTDGQWITDVLYPTVAQEGGPTSTRLWSVINGRLILEAVVQTPAGGYNLYYYVLGNGVEYSFDLEPWYFDKNILTNPDAQTLQAMVQNFAESLPSSTAR